MPSLPTNNGTARIAETGPGNALLGAADLAGRPFGYVKKHRVGTAVAVAFTMLGAGTLLPALGDAKDRVGETITATKDNNQDSLDGASVAVGDTCLFGNCDNTDTPTARPGDTPAAEAPAPTVPAVEAPAAGVANVIAPAGAGGLVLGRLCLGLSADAPLDGSISAEWAKIQANNGGALADGIQPNEQFAC